MEIWQVLLWAVVTIILVLTEIGTVQLVAIWFGTGSLVAFITALCGVDFRVQIITFIVSSIVLLLLTRPLVKKLLKTKRVATNADSIIGQKCIVTEKIDNLHSTGRVFVNGLSWTARATEDGCKFDVDEMCRVVRIEGVKAIVEPLE